MSQMIATFRPEPEDVSAPPMDELSWLELRIARRADDLSRQQNFDWFDPIDNWRQAEREVWKDLVQPPFGTAGEE